MIQINEGKDELNGQKELPIKNIRCLGNTGSPHLLAAAHHRVSGVYPLSQLLLLVLEHLFLGHYDATNVCRFAELRPIILRSAFL